MANIVRLRVERRDGPDAFKNMFRTWKRESKWIKRESEIRGSFETESQKKRRRRRRNWIKKQQEKQQELNRKPERVVFFE